MTSFAIPLVWCILQITLLSAAGGLLYLVVRKLEPRLAVPTIGLVLGLVAMLSLAALSPWPRWQLDGSPPRANEPRAADAPAMIIPQDGVTISHPDSIALPAKQPTFLNGAFWAALWIEMNRPTQHGDVGSLAATAEPSAPWSVYPMVLVTIAAGVGGIRLAAACHALRRLRLRSTPITDPRLDWLVQGLRRRFAVHRPVEIREASQLASAATIGWRRPLILLPAGWRSWPQDELSAVLAHEMAHVAAADWPTWLVAQVAVAVHFYHPLVHLLARRLRLEQEIAADAAAAVMTGSKESYLGNLAAQMLRADQTRPLWATQTFLPTRSTIVRRIEMLKSKSPRAATGRPRGRSRFATAAALLAIGVIVAGIRMPPADTTSTATAQQPRVEQRQGAGAANERPIEQSTADARAYARYADPSALFFAHTRPREIFASDEMAPLQAQINQIVAESTGPFSSLRVEDLEAFAISPSLTADRHEAVRVVLTFAQPVAEAQLQAARIDYQEAERLGAATLYTSDAQPSTAALRLGDHTLILDASQERLKSLAMQLQADDLVLPPWLQDAANRAEDPHLWIALNMERVRDEFARERQRVGEVPPQVAAIAPLIEKPQKAFVVGKFAPDLELTALAVCANEQDAQHVARTAEAFITLARNMIAQQRTAKLPEGTPQAMIAGTLEMADRFLQQAKVETAGNQASVNIAAGSVSQQLIQMGLVLPALQASRQAAQRAQSMNNLKQLALAMHNYHAANGHFPPPILTGPDGKTKHSWRVAILPYLDQAALYDEYRLTEPWDSEHNKRVLESMPAAFRSPTEPSGTLGSAYYVLTGDATVFDPDGDGTPIAEIRDGSSNTFLIVEAKRAIPWTKPEDIAYSSDQPLPELGGHFPGIFLAAFADGSVQLIAQDIDQTVLRRLIEKADGQPVQR